MKRLPTLALIVACLVNGNRVFAQDPTLTPDVYGAQTGTATEFALYGDEGWGTIDWGRINPDYVGCPTVSVSVDLLILTPDAPEVQSILFDGGGLQPILDASDLDMSSRAGARLNLTFFGEYGWDYMLDAMFLGDFESQRTVDTTGGVTLPFYSGIALDPVDTAFYRSDLDTGELNARRRLGPNVALLGGFRYVELNEELDFAISSTPSVGYFSQSDNRLFGVQIGAEAVVPANAYFRIFACGKFGVCNNRYKVAAQATSASSQPLSLRVTDDMESYVGDFNVGFEVQTIPACTLRFGYQVFWVDNVALSVDQLNQYDIFAGTGTVRRGSPTYHGGFGGLVFTF